MNKKTLIRGETLSINVHIDYNKLPITGIDINDIAAEAWFQNNIRVPLTVTEIDGDGNYNLFSDIDTSKLVGDSFLVNVGIKDIEGDAPSNITMASFNETFYIVNSATRLPAEYFTIRFIDYDGAIISIQKARPFDELIVPPSPSREGYDFSRWTPTLNTKIIASVDYTATYVEKTPVPEASGHSVVYRVNGSVYTCQSYAEGATITPPADPIVEGYTFNSWRGLPSTMPADTCVVADADLTRTVVYSEGLAYEDINDTECCVVGRGTCTDYSIVIPPTHNGKTVIGVGVWQAYSSQPTYSPDPKNYYNYFGHASLITNSFREDMVIEKLTIPSTIKYIGSWAFYHCDYLKEIVFLDREEGNEELRLCSHCFNLCGFENLVIPSFVTSDYREQGNNYGINAGHFFSENNNLKSILIEEGFHFPMYYFGGGSNVDKVYGEGMFMYCPRLKTVSLPSTLQDYIDRFFENCYSLENITFNARAIRILGNYCFDECGHITRKMNITFNGNAPIKNYTAGTFYNTYFVFEEGQYKGVEMTINYHGSMSGWTAFKNQNWNTGYATLIWNDLDAIEGE